MRGLPLPRMPPHASSRLAVTGRAFYAVACIFFGCQHLVLGKFVTRIMPPWPAGIPGQPLWPYVIGAALIVGGLAILLGKRVRLAATLLAGMILISAALLALPPALADSSIGVAWTNAGKALALGGGALVVAATVNPREFDPRLWTGRIFLGGFMIVGGVQHFLWVPYVAPLVPTWIPGATFWTYFAAVALIAGGVGLLIPATVRPAALLSGLMVFLWVLLLHIPRALTLRNANEATAVFEALAVSGIAFMLYATDRR